MNTEAIFIGGVLHGQRRKGYHCWQYIQPVVTKTGRFVRDCYLLKVVVLNGVERMVYVFTHTERLTYNKRRNLLT